MHLYWCIKNCGGGNSDMLRAMIMNISKHYQVRVRVYITCFVVYM